MPSIITEFWWLLKYGRGWREVHRTMPHTRLGELHFVGRRTRPHGPVNGYWRITPTGLASPVGVTFASMGGEPTDEGLTELKELLGDLDGLFARSESPVREAYEGWVEEPMPQNWRSAFRLDHIELPDPEDPEAEWQVMYWCEAALHWFLVDFRGDTVTRVEIEG